MLSAAATATVVAIVTTVVSAAGKYEDKNDNPPAAITAEKTVVVAHNFGLLLSVLGTNPNTLKGLKTFALCIPSVLSTIHFIYRVSFWLQLFAQRNVNSNLALSL